MHAKLHLPDQYKLKVEVVEKYPANYAFLKASKVIWQRLGVRNDEIEPLKTNKR